MKTIALLCLLTLSVGVTRAQLPPPPGEHLVWMSNLLGHGWRLYRGDRMTEITIVDDGSGPLFHLYRRGVELGTNANLDTLKAQGVAAAGGP